MKNLTNFSLDLYFMHVWGQNVSLNGVWRLIIVNAEISFVKDLTSLPYMKIQHIGPKFTALTLSTFTENLLVELIS